MMARKHWIWESAQCKIPVARPKSMHTARAINSGIGGDRRNIRFAMKRHQGSTRQDGTVT